LYEEAVSPESAKDSGRYPGFGTLNGKASKVICMGESRLMQRDKEEIIAGAHCGSCIAARLFFR